jgi:hypothetical protein
MRPLVRRRLSYLPAEAIMHDERGDGTLPSCGVVLALQRTRFGRPCTTQPPANRPFVELVVERGHIGRLRASEAKNCASLSKRCSDKRGVARPNNCQGWD